ncbi:MAG: DUF2141 domain-containing protein [Sphingomonadaceae bacterium]
MKRLALPLLLLPAAATAQVSPNPSLGVAEGRCRPNEPGPAFMLVIDGFKDRKGRLRAEVYPANDTDFLADDAVLINAGKTFRRGEVAIPPSGPAQLCLRIPGPGAYSLSILHDRDSNRKFGFSVDGVGFPGNPRLGWSKPKSAKARATAGSGITTVPITLQYLRGLSVGPLKAR